MDIKFKSKEKDGTYIYIKDGFMDITSIKDNFIHSLNGPAIYQSRGGVQIHSMYIIEGIEYEEETFQLKVSILKAKGIKIGKHSDVPIGIDYNRYERLVHLSYDHSAFPVYVNRFTLGT